MNALLDPSFSPAISARYRFPKTIFLTYQSLILIAEFQADLKKAEGGPSCSYPLGVLLGRADPWNSLVR
jgi:hypothetical protein